MINGKMILEGKNGLSLTNAELAKSISDRLPTDSRISISILGPRYAESFVEMDVADPNPFSISTSQPCFRQISDRCRTEDPRNWTKIISQIDPSITFSPIVERYYSALMTSAMSVHKAAFLLYIWMESSFILQDISDVERKIFDEFVVNYRSEIGTQNYLYFIPRELNAEKNLPSLNIIYEKGLLSRFKIEIDRIISYSTYFIPLTKSIEGPNTFNLDLMDEIQAKRLFHSIKNACTIRVKNHFKGME